MSASHEPAVWFPTVRTGTGTDVFTERLVAGLHQRNIRAEISWLPLRAEYASWTVPVPQPPGWANVVHINTWLPSHFLPKCLPVVATLHHSMHDAALRPYKSFARAAYHRWWIAPNERRVLRRADCVVAVSRFVAETARRTLIDIPMNVICNGVNTDHFLPGDRTRRPGEPFRLVYVGNWKSLKGVDLLAPIMRKLGAGFELRYTGGAPAECGHLAMPSNMHDLGRLTGSAVIAAMRDADALLFPTRSEGLPLVAIEAHACGLPVIATCGSSLTEVVEDGVTGILCQQDDVNAFRDAAMRLAEDVELYTSMCIASRVRAVSRFSLARMVDAYVRVYSDYTDT